MPKLHDTKGREYNVPTLTLNRPHLIPCDSPGVVPESPAVWLTTINVFPGKVAAGRPERIVSREPCCPEHPDRRALVWHLPFPDLGDVFIEGAKAPGDRGYLLAATAHVASHLSVRIMTGRAALPLQLAWVFHSERSELLTRRVSAVLMGLAAYAYLERADLFAEVCPVMAKFVSSFTLRGGVPYCYGPPGHVYTDLTTY